MTRKREVVFLSLLALATSHATPDFNYDIDDPTYYSMPPLFGMDEFQPCVRRGGVYCVGSVALTPTAHTTDLFDMMQRYSSNWVERYNHTQLHRALCVSTRCPQLEHEVHEKWFEQCMNATTRELYNFTSRLVKLEYCQRGPHQPPTLKADERAFAGLCAALIVLAIVSTTLDVTLADHHKKGVQWALSWSVRGAWAELFADSHAAPEMRVFDGLRVICMFCVIVEHVCWLGTNAYVVEPRFFEANRRSTDVMLLTNSTLVVQIFFIMSSYLLARKLLRQSTKEQLPIVSTFCSTMWNRIIRISPSYWVVVWLAASGWARAGDGPLWRPLVETEANICRRKWWTHLLYLNNVIYPNDKCLIQTWYLAADMQLYALCTLLTLWLCRRPRAALPALLALLAAAQAALFALAYLWYLYPTFFMHNPEAVRAAYSGSQSFNVLYQSPLGNASGAIYGLALAFLERWAAGRKNLLSVNKIFYWSAWIAPPLAVWWMTSSPLLVPRHAPRVASAAMAVLERPVYSTIVIVALLGALQKVNSPWMTFMAWSGWRVFARLSFAALLLHMPINKAVLALRMHLTQLDHPSVITDWMGITVASYFAALPLAILVEVPCQRLQRALQRRRTNSVNPAPPPPASTDKTDRT